jgi:cytoskeleton protein RodZ
MTKGTFGESLKREREMRGVTLEEITAATRISQRFLKAIEEEQWDQLPGGVFNRGFVRAMAHYLGLDEENTVAEYTLAVGDRQPVPVWTGSPPAVEPQQPWLAWVIVGVVAIVILAGGWFGTRFLLARRAANRATQTEALKVGSSPIAAAASLPSGPSPAPSGNAVPAQGGESEPETVSSNPSVAAAANPAASELLQLRIEADKKTSVTVIADKDVVFDGVMKAGDNQSFNATDHFEVSAGDAGSLRLELNGKSLAPLGSPGQAGKITLTREALKGAVGGQD